MGDGYEVVRRVVELRAPQTEAAIEIVDRLAGGSLVYHFPLNQEEESIEEIVNVAIGLVDGHDDGFVPPLGEIAEVLHNDKRGEGIQSCGWLIQDQQFRVADHLEGD